MDHTHQVRIMSAHADFYLPRTISCGLRNIAHQYYEDPTNEDLYDRFLSTVNKAAARYCDFARAIGKERPSRITDHDQLARHMSGPHWATYRARLINKGETHV